MGSRTSQSSYLLCFEPASYVNPSLCEVGGFQDFRVELSWLGTSITLLTVMMLHDITLVCRNRRTCVGPVAARHQQKPPRLAILWQPQSTPARTQGASALLPCTWGCQHSSREAPMSESNPCAANWGELEGQLDRCRQ